MAAGFVIAYFAGTPRYAHPVESIWKTAAGTALVVVAYSFYRAYESMMATPFF